MATANLNEPTSAANGNIPFIGSASDDGTGNTLRDAITRINARLREIYGSQDGSNVVQTPFIDQDNIKADAIDHDELAGRYTAKATSNTTTSQNLNAANASTFLLTGNMGTATLTIQNMKLGQVIDIIFSGTDLSSAAITLADDFSSSVISKVGSTDFDTSKTNHLQVVCVDDTDSAAILNYSINTYETDTTP